MVPQELAPDATQHHSFQSLAWLNNALSAHQTKEAISTTTWFVLAQVKASRTLTALASVHQVTGTTRTSILVKKNANHVQETRINLDLT